MLEHDVPRPEQTLADLRQSLHSSSQRLTMSGEQARLEQRMEDYLDHIYAPMVEAVSYGRRQEIRREMRAHLDQLVAAHEELGSDRDEAVTAAIRQFGPPSLVARKWLAQLPAEASELAYYERPFRPIRGAFREAAWKLAVGIGMWAGGAVMLENFLRGDLGVTAYLSLGIAIPATIGYVTGCRQRADQSALAMLLAQAVTVPLWPFFFMFLTQQFHNVRPDFTSGIIGGVVSFLIVSPFGCAGAWVGSRVKRLRRKRVAAG
jgi:hypothetical protein